MSLSSKNNRNLVGTPKISKDASPLNSGKNFSNYAPNGFDDDHGIMGRVRRAQQSFADSCCSCVEDIPTSVFLGLVIFFFCMLVLFIAGITVWAASKPQLLVKGNDSSLNEEMEEDDYYDDDGFNSSIRADSFLDIFTERKPMSSDLQLCKGYEFHCRNKPWMSIGQLQRCDGFKDCPDGSDETNCLDCNTAFKCEINSNSQKTHYLCLRGEKLCDGYVDCENGEDEHNCNGKCKDGDYHCHLTTKCIPANFKCDGDYHCLHNDDENECGGKCNNDAVWCPNSNSCVPKWKRCDGIWDCMYGEDERNCTCNECCGTHKAFCAGSGVCISRSKICNGVHDCADGSDEENCPGICRKSVLKKIETVVCSDGRRYSKKLACSGILKICETACDKCNDIYAFSCKQGRKVRCISKAEVCDGKRDCEDGSDEANCVKELSRRCVRTGFSLRPKWLKEEQICDGVYDCMDKEDEQNCNRCSKNGFYCLSTRRCISEFERCNGVIDCLDGSDEIGCTCEDCAYHYPPMFKCANSDQCVKFEDACQLCRNKSFRELAFCEIRNSLL